MLTLFAILIPALIGVGYAYLAAGLGEYGGVLFIGLPIVVSFFSALILRRFEPGTTWGQSYGTSLLSLLALGFGVLIFAIDGAICLAMAFPLAAFEALIGATLGHYLARKLTNRSALALPLALLGAFPLLLGFASVQHPAWPVHEVTSSVEIDAPIATVWREVIAFDRITKPPAGVFRLGIAYPIQARIEGSGVGAIRHCIFSTGPFVEPITTWQPPYLLEFDVISNPPAMKELSPYEDLDPPHLRQRTFESHHGRFRLTEAPAGKVRLEGTTWYTQRLEPDWYWHLFSDHIIHEVHLRVLEQIKSQTETARL